MRNACKKLTLCAAMVFSTGAGEAPHSPHSQGATPEVMVVGYNFVPPDTLQIGGHPAGPANDLLRDVAREMGVTELRFEYMPLARLLEELKNDRIDCINGIGPKGDPTWKINAAIPFLRTTPGLLVASHSKLQDISSADDLRGLTIATKIGMALTTTMQAENKFRIQYVQGDDAIQDAVKMLASNRIDAVYSPRVGELIYFADKIGASATTRPVKLPDPAWDVYVSFSRGGAARFKERYDAALARVLAGKTYDIYLKDFLTRQAGYAALEPLIRPFIQAR